MAKNNLQEEFEPIKLDEKKKKNLASRILFGALMCVVAVPAIIFGGWFFFALIMFCTLVAVYEFMKVPGKKYNWSIWVITYVLTISYVVWAFAKANLQAYNNPNIQYAFSLEGYTEEPNLSWYAMVIGLGIYCFAAIISKKFTFHDVVYLFTMSVLVGIGFQSMLFIRFYPVKDIFATYGATLFTSWIHSAFLLLFVIIATFGTDTMAYFVGIFFGHHKMNSPISPNKSWEGFFGGWILGGLLAFLFALIVELSGHPIHPSLMILGENSKWWAVVLISFTLPLVATLGDFTFSLVKRTYGVKDYGKLLGAHGGILDRVDSLIFCCIATSILLIVVKEGWGFFA